MAQPPGGQTGDGIWLRDALFEERDTFDSSLAHQPIWLRSQRNDNVTIVETWRTGNVYREKASGWTHSPILDRPLPSVGSEPWR